MALGKNLRKQELIPDMKESPAGSGKNKKSGKIKAEQKVKGSDQKAKRMKSPGKSTAATKAKEKTPSKVSPPYEAKNASGERDADQARYISTAEYQRRIKLKEKFARELNDLKDKRIHLIVFRLGSEEYAIEIGKIREVVVTPQISRAPHTPEYIRGVTNIRGSVVMAVDLAHKFHLYKSGNDAENTPGYTMVLNHNRYKVGVLINEVPATLVVDGKSISGSDGILTDQSIHETHIKGVVKEKERMIFFVDVDELLEGDKVHVLPEAIMEK